MHSEYHASRCSPATALLAMQAPTVIAPTEPRPIWPGGTRSGRGTGLLPRYRSSGSGSRRCDLL